MGHEGAGVVEAPRSGRDRVARRSAVALSWLVPCGRAGRAAPACRGRARTPRRSGTGWRTARRSWRRPAASPSCPTAGSGRWPRPRSCRSRRPCHSPTGRSGRCRPHRLLCVDRRRGGHQDRGRAGRRIGRGHRARWRGAVLRHGRRPGERRAHRRHRSGPRETGRGSRVRGHGWSWPATIEPRRSRRCAT